VRRRWTQLVGSAGGADDVMSAGVGESGEAGSGGRRGCGMRVLCIFYVTKHDCMSEQNANGVWLVVCERAVRREYDGVLIDKDVQ
jgi:hypothetical protein